MNTLKIKKIYNSIFINPFFLYAIVWSIIVLANFLNFNTIYPVIPIDLIIFFIFFIIISICLGIYVKKKYLNQMYYRISNTKPMYLANLSLLLIFVAESLYSGFIPLFSILFKGDTATYQNFGIPQLTYLVSLFSFGLNMVNATKLFSCKKSEIIGNVFCSLIPLFRLLLLYSRGAILFCLIPFVLMFFARMKLNFKRVVLFFAIVIVFALGFNAFGNIRHGYSWNDSSYIIELSGFNENYRFLDNFSWSITYISSSVGNLSYNYVNVPSEKNFIGLIAMLIPDVFSKRLFPEFNRTIIYPQPQLVTSTMYAGGYKYFGLFGIIIQYIELCVVILLCLRLTKKRKITLFSTLLTTSMMALFSFFDNMVYFSGYSIFVVGFIFYAIFSRKRDVDLRIMISKIVSNNLDNRSLISSKIKER